MDKGGQRKEDNVGEIKKNNLEEKGDNGRITRKRGDNGRITRKRGEIMEE